MEQFTKRYLLASDFDALVVVTATEEQQLLRTMVRDGASRDQALESLESETGAQVAVLTVPRSRRDRWGARRATKAGSSSNEEVRSRASPTSAAT